MGTISNSVRSIRDSVIEVVACKSGLLLSDYHVPELLSEEELSDSPFAPQLEVLQPYRVRAEVLQGLVVKLRARIGNLPDEFFGPIELTEFLKETVAAGFNIELLQEAHHELIASGKYNSHRFGSLAHEAADELAIMTGIPNDVVLGYFAGLIKWMDRTSTEIKFASFTWDGAVPLSKLFNSEVAPSEANNFLDQQLIDYLAQNPEQLDGIHWRNFERLCAEFFARNGYAIELGTGRDDGGVDIRAWPENLGEEKGPPLMLIQCKRYRQGNGVGIEYVKAFWTDVVSEGAEYGLIATTSSVAPGGHKVCEARGWPLSIKENKQVVEWVQSMWRHAPRFS